MPFSFEEEELKGTESMAPGTRQDRLNRSRKDNRDHDRDYDRDHDRRSRHSKHESQVAYSDEDEYEDRKREVDDYKDKTLRLDDEGRLNMAANDLLVDLKKKEIDFQKTFGNQTGLLTQEQFVKILKTCEFDTNSNQLEMLMDAFKDKKQKDKISVARMKQRFNMIDPTYLNKKAVVSENDAKQRLNNLPESIREGILRIEDYLIRKNIDVKQCFKDMDRNEDGVVSKEEFCRVLIKRYKLSNFNLESLTEIYNALDQNKDNSITIGEFMYFIDGAKRSADERKKQMSADVRDQIIYDIGKLFDEFDPQGRGYIVDNDLFKILKVSGIYLDKNQCRKIINDNDRNQDGKLSRKEFEKVMFEKMQNEIIENEDAIQDLNTMFYNADINKDGFLSIDELDIMFKQHHTNISYEDIVSLMKEIDVDQDGRLDIDEFIALMTMDHESFKDPKSGNTMMKMKKTSKTSAASIAKYFKIFPNSFVESFTTRLWFKKRNLPSSAFDPKINPETLQYKDLREDIKPKGDKDNPVLGKLNQTITPIIIAFQILLNQATGVPVPPKEINTEGKSFSNNNTCYKIGGDFSIVKREVRVVLYNHSTNQYIANTCLVKAEWKVDDKDIWKFNPWKKVGPNPLIFSTKDEELVKDDNVSLIFEFVMLCKMGTTNKDISCGF